MSAIQQVWNSLIRAAHTAAVRRDSERAGELVQTTVRMPSRVHQYYEAVGEVMGLSWQQALVTTNTALVEAALSQQDEQAAVIFERFREIFTWHRLGLHEQLKVLGSYGYTLADIMDQTRALECLSPTLIEDLCDLLNINPAYLFGENNKPGIKTEKWYGAESRVAWQLQSSDLELQLLYLVAESALPHLRSTSLREDASNPIKFALAFERRRSFGNIYITTYEWLGEEPWNYSRTRINAKALVRFGSSLERAAIKGIVLPDELYQSVASYRTHLAAALKPEQYKLWRPEDYIDIPLLSNEIDFVKETVDELRERVKSIKAYKHNQEAYNSDETRGEV